MVTGDRLARRLVAAAVVCILLAALDYILLVRTTLGQRFDNAALAGAEQRGLPTMVANALFLEHITAASFAAVLLVIAGIGMFRHRPRLGLTAATAALVALLLADWLKKSVLTRPPLSLYEIYRHNTFPSGHTAIAIGCAFALILVSPPRLRGLVALLAGSYGWLVAADVQSAGWHRPSDAIASAFLCFAVVAIAAAVLAHRRPVGVGKAELNRPALIVLGLVWCVGTTFASLNAARVLHYLVRHADSAATTAAVLGHAYAFCVNLTVVIVVSLVAALLLVLGGHDLDESASGAAPAPTTAPPEA